MAQVPVTKKDIVISPNFVSKNDTKFFTNNLSKLIGNSHSEFGTDANKLGGLVPDIAVQINRDARKLKDNFSFDPYKAVPDIWTVKPRRPGNWLFPFGLD
jgi:hypothetical protein